MLILERNFFEKSTFLATYLPVRAQITQKLPSAIPLINIRLSLKERTEDF